MTQFLLEEAAFVLLDYTESQATRADLEEQASMARLEAMHDRVLAR